MNQTIVSTLPAPDGARGGDKGVPLAASQFVYVIMGIYPRGEIPMLVVEMIGHSQLPAVGKRQYGSGRLMETHVNRADEHIHRIRFIGISERKHAVSEMIVQQ